MDGLQSFTHLSESIPQWLTRLDELAEQVDRQYERFTKITQFGEVKLSRKKKHDSTESLRPRDVTTTAAIHNHHQSAIIATDTYTPPDPSPPEPRPPNAPNNTLIIQQLRRKRRAGSELSGPPSGQPRYRTRSMIIVYYDSAIQDAFEGLVKAIVIARNNLRKGKTAVTFRARMASLGMGPHKPSLGTVTDEIPTFGSKPTLLSSARSRLGPEPSSSSEAKGFEETDRDLDEAQNLCERAAHQFLRDGDCRQEIEGARKRFENCSALARREMAKLKIEAEAEAAEEVKKKDAEKAFEVEPSPIEEKALVDLTSKIGPPPLKEIRLADTGAIEVDDASEAESVHIDLSAIRRTVRKRA